MWAIALHLDDLAAAGGRWSVDDDLAGLSGLLRRAVAVASISPLVIIFVTVFIDLLGFGIIIPLLPFYAESFGASAFRSACSAPASR